MNNSLNFSVFAIKPECAVKNIQQVDTASFRRRLSPNLAQQRNTLSVSTSTVPLDPTPDEIWWAFAKKYILTTKSMYECLESNMAGGHYK